MDWVFLLQKGWQRLVPMLPFLMVLNLLQTSALFSMIMA